MSIPPIPNPFPSPLSFKAILWIIFICSAGSSLLHFSNISILKILSLSYFSLQKGYFWTFITYPFILPSNHLIDLVFRLGLNLFFIWFFGSNLISRIKQTRFIFFFLGSTLSAAISALPFILFLNHSTILAGPQYFVLSLFTTWTLLHAKNEIPLNISFAIRPFWIFISIILLNLFLDFFYWPLFFAKLGAIFFSYFFCLLSEKTPSSFAFLWPFERSLFRTIERFQTHKKVKKSKIIDFQTGRPLLNDDQFMDTMLSKISRFGEESLTFDEKKRMKQISENKRQNNRH